MIEQEIKELWEKYFHRFTKDYVMFLLKEQLKEIEEGENLDEELADMIIIIVEYYLSKGKHFENVVMRRLMKRYVGRVDRIDRKYWRMYKGKEC